MWKILFAALVLCFCGRANFLDKLVDAIEMELSNEEPLQEGQESTYIVGAKGTVCEDASKVIRTVTECTLALHDLKISYTTDFWSNTYSGIPAGCSVGKNNQPHLERSKSGVGKSRSDLSPICKLPAEQKDPPLNLSAKLCTEETNGCDVSLSDSECKIYADKFRAWNRVLTPRDDYPIGCFLNVNNNIYFNPHGTGKIRPSTTPICKACKKIGVVSYNLGNVGVQGCTNGVPINDAVDCRAALDSLGITVKDVSDSSTYVCYKDGGGNGYNNGYNGGGASYICKATSKTSSSDGVCWDYEYDLLSRINLQLRIGKVYKADGKCYRAKTACLGCMHESTRDRRPNDLTPLGKCGSCRNCWDYDYNHCGDTCLDNGGAQKKGKVYRAGKECYRTKTACVGCLRNKPTSLNKPKDLENLGYCETCEISSRQAHSTYYMNGEPVIFDNGRL